MAVESLEELQRQQASGVPSLTDLQGEQTTEIAADARDPVLGQVLPYRTESQQAWLKHLLLDERDRELFGDIVSPPSWGPIVGREWKPDAAGKLEGYYQIQLGVTPERALGERDLITETLAGQKVPPQKALDLFRESYRDGQVNVQLADLGYQILTGHDTPATWAEIVRLKKQVKGGYSPELLRWWEKMGTAAADQIPLMGETFKAAPFGAVAGGLGGLAAGLLVSSSPTIGEETLIPSMTLGGMKLGAGLAGAARIGQMEAGGALIDLLDAGVDPVIAKAAAWGVGAVNGALEMAEIGVLLKTLPGGRMLGQKALSATVNKLVKEGTLRNLALQHAVRFGTYLSAETAQEVAQESTNIVAEEFSKYLSAELKGLDVQYATADQIKKRLVEIATKSVQGFTVLGIPGSALSAGVDVLQQVRRPAEVLLPQVRTTEISARLEEIPTVKEPTRDQTAQGPVVREVGKGQEPGRAVSEQGSSPEAPAAGGVLQAQGPLAKSGTAGAVAQAGGPPAGAGVAARPGGPAAPERETTPAEIEGQLAGLSYEALKERARQIGITIKGKKAQLAALIADAIKAKAGQSRRTRSERDELRATEEAIRSHPLYQQTVEFGGYQAGSMEVGYENRTRRALVDPDRTYYVEPKYRGDVEGYTGQALNKGYKGALAAKITYEETKGQAWDQALQEQGLEGGFDEFMQGLAAAVEWQQEGPGGIREKALESALGSGDPFLRMLQEKRRLLRARHSGYDINVALEKIAAEYPDLKRADYQDLLVAGGLLANPDEPHPGSMKFKDFLARLGTELARPEGDSPWLRAWSTGAQETPRAMHAFIRRAPSMCRCRP